MKHIDINKIVDKYLGQEVLIVENGIHYHKRGWVKAIRNGVFPTLVINIDGVDKFFHDYEVLKVNR